MNDIKNTILFFEDLKKLRIDKNIELNEIATRTKINIEYLELLESGDYTFLPYIYVRLFMKAYALEIGAKTSEALQELDHFLNKKAPTKDLTIHNEEKKENNPLEDHEDTIGINPFNNLYPSLVKVAILLILVFFGIWVIRQITKDQSESIPIEIGQTSIPTPPKITDTELNMNFTFIDTEEELALQSPFDLSISAGGKTWYEIQTDLGNLTSSIISPDEDILIQFNEYVFLRIENSINVSIQLNKKMIDLKNIAYPADIIFDGETGQLTIRQYNPL